MMSITSVAILGSTLPLRNTASCVCGVASDCTCLSIILRQRCNISLLSNVTLSSVSNGYVYIYHATEVP